MVVQASQGPERSLDQTWLKISITICRHLVLRNMPHKEIDKGNEAKGSKNQNRKDKPFNDHALDEEIIGTLD